MSPAVRTLPSSGQLPGSVGLIFQAESALVVGRCHLPASEHASRGNRVQRLPLC